MSGTLTYHILVSGFLLCKSFFLYAVPQSYTYVVRGDDGIERFLVALLGLDSVVHTAVLCPQNAERTLLS